MNWTPEQTIEVIEAGAWAVVGILAFLFVGVPILRAMWGIDDE